MDEKIYTPQVVDDTPFPNQEQQDQGVSAPSVNQTYSPAVTKDTVFPLKKVAQELLSTTLNTRSKKILKEFSFTPSGAIQIGDYKEAINGDIRISPVGILARNSLGDTTFALDGETGDAIFAGILQAGTLIGGDRSVIIEESVAGNGRIVLYNGGIPAILIGDPS